MSDKGKTYAGACLAGSGFVILDAEIAMTLRPDLWWSGIEAAGDVSTARFRQVIEAWPHLSRFSCRIDGADHNVVVLTRSSDQLAQRIEWIVGRPVHGLVAVPTGPNTLPVAPAVPRTPNAFAGDLHVGVATANGPRTCSSCENFTAGHTCRAAKDSGIEQPLSRVPRRCIAYTPLWDYSDQLTGAKLWPELLGLVTP